ncbi:MAG: AAA family ATPase [SAR324 cluster bacterium]|nr:AAA family ATPase [SAR324 cluster bacterium]
MPIKTFAGVLFPKSIPGYQFTGQGANKIIFEDRHSVYCRGIRQSDNQPVLLKLSKQDDSRLNVEAKFKNEFEIIRFLQGDGFIKAYDMLAHQNHWVMVLEDFDGLSLAAVLQEAKLPIYRENKENNPAGFSIHEFLKTAIQITEILRQLHQQRIIHKNINPFNILYNSQTGQLKFTGFGNAAFSPVDQVSSEFSSGNLSQIRDTSNSDRFDTENLNLFDGILAYISPEQTGRVNRAVDFRSDLYSLGTVFYELLTGQLPFQAENTIELIHCLLAQQPIQPYQLNSEIPYVLSDIVLKLMAKLPNDRYQSCLGLKSDLELCLGQLSENNTISPLVLGKHDAGQKIEIPRKLYGRQRELQTLFQAFDRVNLGGREVVSVTGEAGIGKSSLIQAFSQYVDENNGYYISGKFDQFRRDISFSTLIEAFQRLIRQLLGQKENQVEVHREKLAEALGVNGGVIIDVIPELELIVGPQPPLYALSGIESRNRFNFVFQRFVRALCHPKHPLVIFLDDLQWADPASLNLLELLTGDVELPGLLLIFACRSNVEETLNVSLTEFENRIKSKGIVTSIQLSPLPINVVGQFIADIFRCSLDSVQELARVCIEKTSGNPFFLGQFLKTLNQKELIEFNSKTQDWHWEVEKIKQSDITGNVAGMMVEKFQKYSPAAQRILQIAACLGNTFSLYSLSLVNQQTLEEIRDILSEALQEGLIVDQKDVADDSTPVLGESRFKGGLLPHNAAAQEQAIQVRFSFSHDRVQEGIYSLITEHERSMIHLKVGRILLQNASEKVLEENLFEIVNHLNRALHLIESASERKDLAELNLKAAQKAKNAFAYSTAVTCLKTGITLLPESSWNSDYSFFFALHLELTEACFLNAKFEEAGQLLELLLKNVQTDEDRWRVCYIEINRLILETRFHEAFEAVAKALKLLDIVVPRTEKEFSQAADEEITAFPRFLAGRTIADLAEESEKTGLREQYKLIFLDCLANIAYQLSDNPMLKWTSIKGGALCLKNGNNQNASFSYVVFAAGLVRFLKEYKNAFEYGQMAVALSEKYEDLIKRGRTYYIFAVFISPLKTPLKESITMLRKAIRLLMETSDFIYASYAVGMLLMYQIVSGEKLSKISEVLETYTPFLRQTSRQQYEKRIRPAVLQVLKNLTGTTISGTFTDIDVHADAKIGMPASQQSDWQAETSFDRFNEQDFLRQNQNRMILSQFHYAKIRSLTLFGEYEEALQYLDQVELVDQDLHNTIFTAEASFYMALAITAKLAAERNKTQKKRNEQYLQILDAFESEMKFRSDHAPANFEHKHLLLEAERAKLAGDLTKAMDLYKQGISSAKNSGFVHIEALGNELYARFWLENGEVEYARIHLVKARRLFQKWGAAGKVRQLEETYQDLFVSVESLLGEQRQVDQLEQLDLDAIIKASQALSGEIDPEKLLDRLMNIIIENAGAQKGWLLFKQNDDLFVEAAINAEKNEVLIEHVALQESMLPLNILRFVLHTGNLVRIENASDQHDFSQDPFFTHSKPLAILCVPLKKKEKVEGMLYLQNDITSGIFGEDRIQMLEVLLAQAAISLENARFYQHQQATLAREKELSELKDEFLANTSHELRTPLHGIIGLAEGMLDTAVQSIGREELSLIVSSGKRLSHLIDDILDFSLLKSEELELALKAVDLREIAETVITACKPLLKSESVVLLNEISSDLPPAHADEDRLQQILYNLVGNAVKFTHQGIIRVEAFQKEAVLIICVRDTGIGFDLKHLEQIFTPFERTDEISKSYPGIGLGLAITKQLIELHKGKIEVESVIGKGSHFYFSLPVSKKTAAPLQVLPDRIQVKRGPSAPDALSLVLDAHGQGEVQDNRSDDSRYHILIVDDDPVNLRVVAGQLTPRGYRMTSAVNGLEALEILEDEGPFDLIVLDVMMPQLNGYQTCRKIREKFSKGELPIILLTAKNRVDDLSQGLQAGANDYLTKPFSREELLARVEAHLQLKDSFQQMQENIALRREIQVRQQSEQQLTEDRLRLSQILNVFDDAVCAFTELETITFLNQSALKFFGYPEDALLEHPLMQLFGNWNFETVRQSLRPWKSVSGAEVFCSRQILLSARLQDRREIEVEADILNWQTSAERGWFLVFSLPDQIKSSHSNVALPLSPFNWAPPGRRLHQLGIALETVLPDYSHFPTISSLLRQNENQEVFFLLEKDLHFRKSLVELLALSLIYWEETTAGNKVDLAENSGLWSVFMEQRGVFRARTLERHLKLKTLPKKPRWQAVLQTAQYVLHECPSSPQLRQQLEKQLALLMDQLPQQ